MRRYAFTRVASGDYLVPSNDGLTLWRIYRYQDGRACGLDVDYELRTFWSASSTPMPLHGFLDRAEVSELTWREGASMLPSKRAAEEWIFGADRVTTR